MSDAQRLADLLRDRQAFIMLGPAHILQTGRSAADLIEQQAARIATLEQTLREIANADTVEWDDPTEFEAWAKSRARWTLAKGDKA